jgi:glycosyltransferase involved in cell wall biosynthesis
MDEIDKIAMKSEKVSVIIPAYNEAQAIGSTVKDVQSMAAGSGRNYEIIVVDDGSTDGTGDIAEQAGAKVMRHRRNKGYGASLKTGVLESDGDMVVFFDADNQFESADIERVVEAAESAHAAFGSRTSRSYAPFSRKGGKKLLGLLANYLAKTKIPDLNCGLRAIRRGVLLEYLHLLPNGFSASTTTTLIILREGYEVAFVPITVKKRVGKSTVRPIKDGIETALLVLRLTTLLDPFRVFGPASIFLFVFGVIWGTHYLLKGRGLSMASLFLLVSSVTVFFFGLLADQIASLRRERRYTERKH